VRLIYLREYALRGSIKKTGYMILYIDIVLLYRLSKIIAL
jgi:hypothetical protein